jgi:hypothetical protein
VIMPLALSDAVSDDTVATTFCAGGATPDDEHLLATVHCVDDEIVAWLEQRERRRRKKKGNADAIREPDVQASPRWPVQDAQRRAARRSRAGVDGAGSLAIRQRGRA